MWAQAAWIGVRLLAGAWLLARLRAPVAPPGARRPVAVVVPARDEAATVPTLLASVLPQRRPGDEVVVVDDGSTDGTAEVAASAGARVVAAPPPPAGWTGKPWACSIGAGATTEPTLAFVDADVTLLPGALDAIAGQPDDGLVSVQPYHRTQRHHESLSAFCNLVTMMGSGAFAPAGERASAFGPVLVTSRQLYERVGGHASVAGSALEDVALARRYQSAGLPVRCFAGRGVAEFRMYPAGLRQLVEGWTKNLAAGAGSARLVPLVLTIAWLSVCIEAVWTPIAYVPVALEVAWLLRRIGRFRWWAWALFPIPLALFLGVFLRSAFRTVVRRRVTWKGRELSPRL